MKTTSPPRTKRTRTRKILLIVAGIILLLAIAAPVYVYAFGGNLFGWTASSPSSPSSDTDQSPSSEQPSQDNSVDENTNNSSKNDDPSTPPPAPTDELSVSLPYTSSTRTTVLIDGVLGAGTCTLTLSRNGSTPITMTAETYAGPSSTTCKGFTYDQLSGSGWKASVTVTVGTKSGSASRMIE